MSEEKYWKILWSNVKLSATYGAGGGRVRQGDRRGTGKRDLTITLEDIKSIYESQGERCYWLNIRLNLEDLVIKDSPFAPSVERLDNALGYVPGNIVIASRFANRGRGAYSGDDFQGRLNSLLEEAREDSWMMNNKSSYPLPSRLMNYLGFGRMKLANT